MEQWLGWTLWMFDYGASWLCMQGVWPQSWSVQLRWRGIRVVVGGEKRVDAMLVRSGVRRQGACCLEFFVRKHMPSTEVDCTGELLTCHTNSAV